MNEHSGESKKDCLFLLDCVHGLLPFLLSYSVSVFSFSLLFFVSVPCARLSWPSRQLLIARKSTVIVSYRIVKSRTNNQNTSLDSVSHVVMFTHSRNIFILCDCELYPISLIL